MVHGISSTKWDCIKVGGGALLAVVDEFVVGSSAATRGKASRADCRERRNEPAGAGGQPLETIASAGVSPSSGLPSCPSPKLRTTHNKVVVACVLLERYSAEN